MVHHAIRSGYHRFGDVSLDCQQWWLGDHKDWDLNPLRSLMDLHFVCCCNFDWAMMFQKVTKPIYTTNWYHTGRRYVVTTLFEKSILRTTCWWADIAIKGACFSHHLSSFNMFEASQNGGGFFSHETVPSQRNQLYIACTKNVKILPPKIYWLLQPDPAE